MSIHRPIRPSIVLAEAPHVAILVLTQCLAGAYGSEPCPTSARSPATDASARENPHHGEAGHVQGSHSRSCPFMGPDALPPNTLARIFGIRASHNARSSGVRGARLGSTGLVSVSILALTELSCLP